MSFLISFIHLNRHLISQIHYSYSFPQNAVEVFSPVISLSLLSLLFNVVRLCLKKVVKKTSGLAKKR